MAATKMRIKIIEALRYEGGDRDGWYKVTVQLPNFPPDPENPSGQETFWAEFEGDVYTMISLREHGYPFEGMHLR